MPGPTPGLPLLKSAPLFNPPMLGHSGKLFKNTYEIEWNGLDENGNSVPSGIYMVNLITNDNFYSRKVTLIK